MINLLKKKPKEENKPTPSQENEAALPLEKKSRSAIKTSRTNYILLAIAFLMLGVFIVGSMITANKNQSDVMKIDTSSINNLDEEKKALEKSIPYISPIINTNPPTIKMDGITIGQETLNTIMVSVQNTPIKITDVNLSSPIDGMGINQDCTDRPEITPENGCQINLVWTPTKRETKNIFLVINYNDSQPNPQSTDTEQGKPKSVKISISLQSIDAPPQIIPTNDAFFDDNDEGEEFYEDDFIDEESYDPLPAPTTQKTVEAKQTVYPDDCKKYASKTYDFSGTFIGWAQGNNDIFSPNCSTIIGTLSEDGMVIETGTGRVIGKGAILNKKKSDEKRIELALPILDEVMQTINSENFTPNFEEVSNNRQAAKQGNIGGTKEKSDTWDPYQADDYLGLFKKQKNELIPFTISDTSQISSMPKNEKYVLRQSKPIPAVLSRPIYFGNDPEVTDETYEDIGNAIAVVERNVYGGDGRTIIIPTGSQLIGTAARPASAGLQEVAKISISWERLIRPDGAEFDLSGLTAYTGDAQGRSGVPGKNDTEYMRNLFIKPFLYSAVPVAMEALFPSTSKLVNRVKRSDGVYQTVDVSVAEEDRDYAFDWNENITDLNLTSKDKMKAEIQQNWKTTMQDLIEQSAKTSIPFTVAAGTRVMIFLKNDVMLRIDDEMEDMIEKANEYKKNQQ